jgi:cytochrome P450
MISFASANRDERHWNMPDAFDISRPKSGNLVFGMGHHYCLGVWLSRAHPWTCVRPGSLTHRV